MSQNVTINGYSLQDGNASTAGGIVTSKIDHESASVNQAKVTIPHRDGEKLVSYVYGSRKIHLEGWVFSPTASGLDGKVDDMKRNLIGLQNAAMLVDYAGQPLAREYTVNVTSVGFTREPEYVTACPYVLEAEAINPPFGMSTATISGISTSTLVSGTLTSTVWVSGTANPQPFIRLAVHAATGLTDIEFKNLTTSSSVKVSPGSFSSGDVVTVDLSAYAVLLNNLPATYTGAIPSFVPGLNNIQINTYGTASGISNQIDSQQTSYNTAPAIYNNYQYAQTVTPNSTGTYNQIDLLLSYSTLQAPTNALTVSVYADSSGSPGSLVATTTIPASSVTTSFAWVSALFSSPFSMTQGSIYWIIISASTTQFPAYYEWGYSSYNPYAGGSFHDSNTSGATWGNQTGYDFTFKLYRAVTSTWTVGYGMQYAPFWL